VVNRGNANRIANAANDANAANAGTRLVAPGIYVRATDVDTPEDIPNTRLYWIKSTEQFGVQIGGVLVRGNIGNIFARSFGNRVAVRECTRPDCDRSCNFFHDPAKMGPGRGMIRNFTSSSWIYTDSMLSRKNLGMRHVGSRNTLLGDLQALKFNTKKGQEEAELRRAQTAHDLLVLLCVHQCGALA